MSEKNGEEKDSKADDNKKTITPKEVTQNIKDNYRQLEKTIANQLNMAQKLHGTTAGTQREDIWKDLFIGIVPKKFVIEHSIFIVDSKEQYSKEVDLAIIDEMYTPYIFRYGKLKFVPIEAVAVVIECKSTSQDLAALESWSDSIDKLKTCGESILRVATKISGKAPATQPSTHPIKILCRLNSTNSKKLKEIFDFIISVKNEKISVYYDEKQTLEAWNKKLNFYSSNLKLENKKEIEKKYNEVKTNNEGNLSERKLDDYVIPGCSLLSLNFQLNQLLMLLNNPMPFPHLAYVNLFKDTQIVAVAIEKVQQYLYYALSNSTQESLGDSGTLQQVIQSSKFISETFAKKICNLFALNSNEDCLLSCSGKVIFESTLSCVEIEKKLNTAPILEIRTSCSL